MKIIGMLFEDRVSMEAAFYRHAYGLITFDETKDNVKVKTGMRHTIEIDDSRWMYLIVDNKSVDKIAGIQFDAIFSEVRDPDLKFYILSRFRPGFNTR